MSASNLPPELLDHVVDIVCDNQVVLKNCCLVSKSWIPRTRSYLFADVRFDTEGKLESWGRTFPDPSTSPAHYTKTLLFHSLRLITAADAKWIKAFSRVEHFQWVGGRNPSTAKFQINFVPFHGFSPVIKSLILHFATLPTPHLFDLVFSFPLLEDLTTVCCYDLPNNIGKAAKGPSTVVRRSGAPAFTGCLDISDDWKGLKSIARQLSPLPDGIRFRKLVLRWYKQEDFSWTRMLVEMCSHTLESLDIACYFSVEPMPAPVGLSKATRLKDVSFRVNSQNVEWITAELRTIPLTHRDLRQISIYVPYRSIHIRGTTGTGQTIGEALREMVRQQWLDLDPLLVQFWESHSIRPRVTCEMPAWEEQHLGDYIERLLPEVTRRGMMDLVE